MSAEFAKAEVIAKRFGKTMADVRAEENAQILKNSAALKQLNAERMAAKTELDRYNTSLQANTSGLKTVADANKAENDELLRKSAILKQLNKERQQMRGISGDLMTVPANADYIRKNKQNEYLLRKAGIMGTMGGGMAPGFAKLLATESAMSESGTKASQGWLAGFVNNLKGHGSGGMQQLIHVGRATFDSLASGMSPWRVMLQQAPQALQAFASMTGEALSKIFRMAFNPITLGITAALAAVGGGAYMIYRHFQNLQVGLENVAQRFGLARTTMSEMHDEMVKSADAARDFTHWMHSLAGAAMSVADKTAVVLKRLREQFELEKEIAKLRGATPQQLLKMEMQQLQKEQDVVNRARELAYEKRAIHQQEARDAQKAIKDSETDRAMIGSAEKRSAFMSSVGTAIKKQLGLDKLERQQEVFGSDSMLEGEIIGSNPMTGQPIYGQRQTVSQKIESLANTIVDIEVEGQKFHGSLADANREMLARQGKAEQLKRVQEELKETLAKKQKLTQDDVESIRSLSKQEADIISAMNMKLQYGPTIAAGGGATAARDISANQRIGAYAMPQVQTQIELQKKTNEKLDKIVSNTDPAKQNGFDAAFGGN